MPNWCANSIEISHQDSDQISLLKKAAQAGSLFESLLPVPDAVKSGPDSFYRDWVIANWGTKWDVDCESVEELSENKLTLMFDSAWSPPIEFYKHLVETLKFSLHAYYYEPGNYFCGEVKGEASSEGFCTFENKEYSIDQAPEYILDFFGHDSEEYLED